MAMAAGSKAEEESGGIIYVLTYLLSLVSGIIVYFVVIPSYDKARQDKKLKRHAIQAMVLGVISIVVGAVLFFIPFFSSLIPILIWVYGLYVGYRASINDELDIPYVTDYAKSLAG